MTIQSGTLYIVATPIGNLADMSYRAVDVLKSVQHIAAEDTRHSQRLFQQYHITTPTMSLHDFNENARSQQLIELLQQGDDIALISDAGTPLISDPGYRLVQQAREAEINVQAIPGCCAAIAALSIAGLPTDKFIFEGFLSAKTASRLKRLQQLKHDTRTIVCYESPHRILAMLQDIQTAMGAERHIVIARELTKQYETVLSATVADVINTMQNDNNQQKGEFVVLIAGDSKHASDEINDRVINTLAALMEELPSNKAIKLTARITGISKNVLYDWFVANK